MFPPSNDKVGHRLFDRKTGMYRDAAQEEVAGLRPEKKLSHVRLKLNPDDPFTAALLFAHLRTVITDADFSDMEVMLTLDFQALDEEQMEALQAFMKQCWDIYSCHIMEQTVYYTKDDDKQVRDDAA